MKNLILTLISIFVFLIGGHSQEFVTVNGLADGKQWQIIEKAIYESGYKIGKFNPAEKTILTNWIQWKVITVQNRGILKVELSGQDATISMIDRSYKTSDKWGPAIGKLSKKNKKKYLQKLADKITEINASAAMTEDAVENSVLFPAFKSITKVLGVEWKVDSIYQLTESPKKELMLCFTLTNTNSYPVTMGVSLWNEKYIFLGVQAKMKNMKAIGEVGNVAYRPYLNAGDKVSTVFYYSSSDILTKIPKFVLGHYVNKGSGKLIIYDIKIPYYSK